MGANADDASINQKIVRILDHSDFRAIVQSLAAVAQLDRVLGYEPRGRGFDSCQPHHTVSPRTAMF